MTPDPFLKVCGFTRLSDGLHAGHTGFRYTSSGLGLAICKALLEKIAQLQIQEILGTQAKAEYRQNKPSHTIGLTLKDGSTIDYTISKPADTTYYVLKSSTRPEYFKVPTYMLDTIFDTKREKLVEAKQPQAEENKAS